MSEFRPIENNCCMASSGALIMACSVSFPNISIGKHHSLHRHSAIVCETPSRNRFDKIVSVVYHIQQYQENTSSRKIYRSNACFHIYLFQERLKKPCIAQGFCCGRDTLQSCRASEGKVRAQAIWWCAGIAARHNKNFAARLGTFTFLFCFFSSIFPMHRQ